MDGTGNFPTSCTARHLKTELSSKLELDAATDEQYAASDIYRSVQGNKSSHVARRAATLSTRQSTAPFNCSLCFPTANLALVSTTQVLCIRLWYVALYARHSKVSSASTLSLGEHSRCSNVSSASPRISHGTQQPGRHGVWGITHPHVRYNTEALLLFLLLLLN